MKIKLLTTKLQRIRELIHFVLRISSIIRKNFEILMKYLLFYVKMMISNRIFLIFLYFIFNKNTHIFHINVDIYIDLK